MIGRLIVLIGALAAGFALASFFPQWPERIRSAAGFSSATAPRAEESPSAEPAKSSVESKGDQQSIVKLDDDEIKSAGIESATARAGTIAHRIVVPGTIIPHADRIAHVAVKVSGTVAELRKKVGDAVAANEVLAILESREFADAKSEYLAARLTNELQQDLFEREKVLWDKKISTEQQYLRSRNQAANAKMRNDITRQKLFALGLTEPEIANLPNEPEAFLRRQEVRSPLAGRVVERKVDLGAAVGRDNLETELFVIADLDPVWVDLAISPADLPLIKEGQAVSITTRGIAASVDGKIVFIGPMLDKDSRSARAVAEIANDSGMWRPGSFVTAAIAFEEQPVTLGIPMTAVQNIGAATVVFVQVPEGFQKRQVVLGQSDERMVEVSSGFRPGEVIAVTNTFLLKAELLKALAED
jgi:cobalt-zinc-cadmium efflux system membrane fusion protein